MKEQRQFELEKLLTALRLVSHRVEEELASQNICNFNIPDYGWGGWSNLQVPPPIYEYPLQSGLQSPEDDSIICLEVLYSVLASSELLKQLGLLGLQTMKEGDLVYWNMSGRIDGQTLKRLYEQLSQQQSRDTEK